MSKRWWYIKSTMSSFKCSFLRQPGGKKGIYATNPMASDITHITHLWRYSKKNLTFFLSTISCLLCSFYFLLLLSGWVGCQDSHSQEGRNRNCFGAPSLNKHKDVFDKTFRHKDTYTNAICVSVRSGYGEREEQTSFLPSQDELVLEWLVSPQCWAMCVCVCLWTLVMSSWETVHFL